MIPRRSEELTVAAVGGNRSKSSKITVSGTISLILDIASNSVLFAVSIDDEVLLLTEAQMCGNDFWYLKMRFDEIGRAEKKLHFVDWYRDGDDDGDDNEIDILQF